MTQQYIGIIYTMDGYVTVGPFADVQLAIDTTKRGAQQKETETVTGAYVFDFDEKTGFGDFSQNPYYIYSEGEEL
jgi:hypothetical protein